MSEAPKFAVHAPQAEPQSAVTAHITGDATKAEEAIQAATVALHPDTEAQITHNHADGEATIKAGESTVIVEHGVVGAVHGMPNIALHFTASLPPDNFSYVVNLTAKSFQVNLSAPVTEDTPFTWSADT